MLSSLSETSRSRMMTTIQLDSGHLLFSFHLIAMLTRAAVTEAVSENGAMLTPLLLRNGPSTLWYLCVEQPWVAWVTWQTLHRRRCWSSWYFLSAAAAEVAMTSLPCRFHRFLMVEPFVMHDCRCCLQHFWKRTGFFAFTLSIHHHHRRRFDCQFIFSPF